MTKGGGPFFRSLFSLWGFILARTKPHRLKHVPLALDAPSGGARWMEWLARLLGKEERRAFAVHQEQRIVAGLADRFLELRDGLHGLMVHFLNDVSGPQSR